VLHHVPRLLGNDQEPDPEFGHNRHGLGRYRCCVRAAPKRAQGKRPNIAARLLCGVATFHVAVFKGLEHEFGMFHKTLPADVLVDPETIVLHSGQASAHTENHAAAGEVIEKRDLLGDAHGIVPGQHDDHRPQFNPLGFARHIRKKLDDVRTHGVIGEVVFDRPYRVKTKGLSHLGQA
jgi:hypothetical protein